MILIITSSIFFFIILLGFVSIRKEYSKYIDRHNAVVEFRSTFIEMSNEYYSTYDRFERAGKLDLELYTKLTMSVDKIQRYLGSFGILHYTAPFRTHTIPKYQVIINTLPKFRDGNVTENDVNMADDCLLRYIGSISDIIDKKDKNLYNPIIWFKDGFQQIVSLPIYLINWFGIISDNKLSKIISNTFYKILTGIGGLVAFLSGLVAIIQGKEQTIEFIQQFFKK